MPAPSLLPEELTSAELNDLRAAEQQARYLGEAVIAGFEDEEVTEIYTNPHDGQLWFDTRGRGKVSTGIRLETARILQLLNANADRMGLTLGENNPQLQAELPPVSPFRGARLQGFLPPIASAPCFIIRKLPTRVYSLDDFVSQGMLEEADLPVLRHALSAHWNVLVAGGTGTGKTTFAGALLQEITALCPTERLVLLEDTVELQCPARDHLALRTTPDLSLSALVRHTLRAYPDRIVVGEVRGPEALDLLDAWSTGHPGGLGTFHAQDAAGALLRLDRLCRRAGVPSQAELIAEAIDLIVLLEGSHRTRRVKDLVRIHGLDRNGAFRLESLCASGREAGSPAPA